MAERQAQQDGAGANGVQVHQTGTDAAGAAAAGAAAAGAGVAGGDTAAAPDIYLQIDDDVASMWIACRHDLAVEWSNGLGSG